MPLVVPGTEGDMLQRPISNEYVIRIGGTTYDGVCHYMTAGCDQGASDLTEFEVNFMI